MMTRRTGFLAIVIVAGACMAAAIWLGAVRNKATPGAISGAGGDAPQEAIMEHPDRPGLCQEIVFEGARAVVCSVDPARQEIVLSYRDEDGKPYGSVARAAQQLAAKGGLVLAMNAGMYHSDLSPVGLYVENGIEIAPLETGDDFGNFYLKPNGVFFIGDDGRAGILETEAYNAAGLKPAFATQSGPMLLIKGAVHPRFLPDGTTRYIRNGVGVRTDGTVVLVITRDPLSLGSFARLFADAANCSDALFFDGGVSSLAWGSQMEIDSGDPAGPVVAVFEKPRD